MTFTPSIFQQAVYDFVSFSNGNAIVEAVAGSGKSTLLKGICDLNKYSTFKTVIVAFNAPIAKELRDDGYGARTFNSLGYGALLNSGVVSRSVKLDPRKSRVITKRLLDNKQYKMYGGQVPKAVAWAKARGIVPHNTSGEITGENYAGLSADKNYNWKSILIDANIWLEDEDADEIVFFDLCRKVLAASILDLNVIDFDDQLYLPIIMGLDFKKFSLVLIDEAQDLNHINREIVKRMTNSHSRVIAVGDRHQSLYSFRGADFDSMDILKRTFDCKEFPLSVCYRCPTEVVNHAKTIVPQIEAREGAPEGVLEVLGEFKHSVFGPQDLVLCRNNAPLIHLAYNLIRYKVPINLLSSDFKNILMKVLDHIIYMRNADNSDESSDQIAFALVILEEWKEKRIGQAMAVDNEDLAEKYSDEAEAIEVVISSSTKSTIEEIIQEVKSIFFYDKGRGAVTLSTIHKAKGSQAERVFWLDSHLCTDRNSSNPQAEQTELNLEYVAVTRAMSELYYVNSEDFIG